jgi:ribose transport system permease protein
MTLLDSHSSQSASSAAPVKRRGIDAGALKQRLLSGAGGPLIGLILLFVVLSITAPRFLTARNLTNIVDQGTVLGILALGATAVILTGGIDLSVGSVVALCVMILGWLSHDGGWPLWLAMVASVAVGGVAGAVNGVAITRGKLPPFIATLAMMSVASGAANLMTDGQPISGYPAWFASLSTQHYFGFFSITTIGLIVLYVVGGSVLGYRPAGRAVYAIGGNSEVARLAGIHVKSVTTWVYVFAGFTAGLAAIVFASRLDSSQPSAGMGIELDVIAAVVIGGASLTGGVGRVTGTIVGVLIIGVLRNGLNLLGVSSFLQDVIIGVVIAGAVLTDVLRRRRT